MKNLSKREKVLLLIVCLIIIGYVSYNYALLPQLKKIKDVEVSIDNNKKILAALYELNKSIDNSSKEVNNLAVQLEDIEKSVPKTKRIPEIIMNIEEITKNSGSEAVKLAFGSGQNEDKAALNQSAKPFNNEKNGSESIMTLNISCEVICDYSSIIAFINKIENCSRKMIIERLQVNRESKSAKLHAYLNIKCFYLSESELEEPEEYTFMTFIPGKQNIFN